MTQSSRPFEWGHDESDMTSSPGGSSSSSLAVQIGETSNRAETAELHMHWQLTDRPEAS